MKIADKTTQPRLFWALRVTSFAALSLGSLMAAHAAPASGECAALFETARAKVLNFQDGQKKTVFEVRTAKPSRVEDMSASERVLDALGLYTSAVGDSRWTQNRIIQGQPLLSNNEPAGFAGIFVNARSTEAYDPSAEFYWPGITLSIESSTTAKPTRFDMLTIDRAALGAKPWTAAEEAEYHKWVATRERVASFNFNPAGPATREIIRDGSIIVVYDEVHPNPVMRFAKRRIEFLISPTNALQKVKISNRFTRPFEVTTDPVVMKP